MVHNTNKNLYFIFNKDVILTTGYRRAIIHNLNNGSIYSIDEDSKNILCKILSGASINESLISFNEDVKAKFYIFLDKLCSLNIGQYYSYGRESGKIIYNKVIHKRFDTVWLELTKKCNERCIHCYGDYGFSPNYEELSINQWKNVINSISRFHVKKIVIIGGEPLLYKDLLEIINYCRQKMNSTEIVLYSNLLLFHKINRLDNKFIHFLQSNNIKVVTSIYSHNKKIHDNITKVKGSFEKTVDAINCIRNNNIYIKANTVVMKDNYMDLKNTKDFIHHITGRHAGVDIVRDVGNSKISLLPSFIEKDPRIMSKANFKPIMKDEFIRNYSGNSCFQGKINITSNGYVSPCIMSEKFIDKNYNVKNHSIDKILDEYIIPKFWSLSKNKNKKCSLCEYRYVCKDCVPQNGDLYKPNIFCKYDPVKGKWNN